MTKNDSLILKGVAILFMLWHHLFWNDSFRLFYTAIGLTISGEPIEQRLGRLCDPVALFVFLSGYGLYKSYAQRQHSVSTICAVVCGQHQACTQTIHPLLDNARCVSTHCGVYIRL